jgi:2-keto-4-pentenoate hydratase/2-oxohepta-3-ene-1,7-dioic acid hydratase in catechol pathway
MKFVSYIGPSGPGYGLLTGAGIIALEGRLPARDLKALAGIGLDAAKPWAKAAPDFTLASVALLPPITTPAKILCVGINYDEHRAETGRAKSDYPTIFTRFADTLVAEGRALLRPTVSTMFDYEGELAVIIGKGGRYIPPSRALGHVAGYSCFNDASVRDWQRHASQFTPGKNFPATGGFGPALVSADEVGDPQTLKLTTRLNGQVMQEATTDQMIFKVADIIAYVSSFTRLEPGDVIATGTPGGVGQARNPQVFMAPGDKVEVEISKVGTLTNSVAADEIRRE